MPVPKRKRSKTRRDKRFANKGIKVKSFSGCSNCQEPIIPHVACKNCGYYKGAKVMRTKEDRGAVRAEERQAKEVRQKQAEENQAESSD